MERQTIVAGNWKMHGDRAQNQALFAAINDGLTSNGIDEASAQVLVFPTSVYLTQLAQLISDSKSAIGFGAQNVSEQTTGAFTGEISANMLLDAGCSHVLVGHSERRSIYNESNALVASKFETAINAGLTPILCIGETLEQRDAGQTMDVVLSQIDAVIDISGVDSLSKGIIAYEPVWAIGTGKTASPAQAQDVHCEIRKHLSSMDQQLANSMQILYGGSVNATNATELFAMADIDGGLIGGAALKADEFLKICVAAGK